MASGTVKIFAATVVLVLLATAAARTEPMKCSGEEKVCIANCANAASTPLSVCLTNCGARKSYCIKTGCWDNGAQKYCGLAKQ